jgi:hypothetical protein
MLPPSCAPRAPWALDLLLHVPGRAATRGAGREELGSVQSAVVDTSSCSLQLLARYTRWPVAVSCLARESASAQFRHAGMWRMSGTTYETEICEI